MSDEGTKGHPEDGRLLAHLDGELAAPMAARLEEHLEGCGDCRRRREELAEASMLLTRELRARDVAIPPGDPLAVRRAARRRATERGGASHSPGDADDDADGDAGRGAAKRRSGRPGRSTYWKAAALVLGVGAAASAAVPGSPVQGWIGDAVRALAATFADDPAQAGSPAPDTTVAAAEPQGVSVPVSDRAVVRIVDPAPGLRVHVRSVEDTLLSVVARGARYRAGDGVIEVLGPNSPELRIELPTAAATVLISSGDVPLLERSGGRLLVRAAAADTVDGTITFPADGGDG